MKKEIPEWITKSVPPHEQRKKVGGILKDLDINTVCQEADCPNIGECFSRETATFMISGKNCTRSCKFCAVSSSTPEPVDPKEPQKIAEAVKALNLKYVVLTSVTRDDLPDGGIEQFRKTVNIIKKTTPEVNVEILTPDFLGEKDILKRLKKIKMDVFAHNVETVPGLYDEIRPQAVYSRSLEVLNYAAENISEVKVKSGLMVGLGESKEEVISVLKDLKEAGVEIVTIGQYLSPSDEHAEVQEFIPPEKFDEYEKIAQKLGFEGVASGTFVRSSYKAEELTGSEKETNNKEVN